MLPANVEIEQSGGVVTAHIGLSEVSGNDMQEVVEECIDKMRYSNAHNFVFDMTTVEYLESSSVGALVSLLQEAEHMRGRIALACCQDNVAFLFKVTRLDAVFGMFDDVQQAVNSF
jgi:anti-sigma B factor antagonist